MERKFINMLPNEIEISVCGRSASGKSTIIGIIESALILNGFKNIKLSGTILVDGDYEFTKKHLDKKIKQIRKKNPEIVLKEVQAIANFEEGTNTPVLDDEEDD